MPSAIFGFQLGRRQWAGVIVTATGLAIIGLTSGSDAGEPRHYAVAALIGIECGILVLSGALAAISTHRRVSAAAQGLLLGAAAGALFGVSDIAIKFLVDDVASGVLELISPWTVAALIASVGAFYASARGLQLGPGVEVIALTSVAANLTGDRRRHSRLPRPGRHRGAGDRHTDARVLSGDRRGRPHPRPGASHATRPPDFSIDS